MITSLAWWMLLAAIVVSLFVIITYIPLFGLIGSLLTISPIILATLRYGFRYALLVILAAVFLSVILEPSTIFALLSIGTFSLFLGMLIREGTSAGRVVLVGGMAILLIFGLEIVIFRALELEPPVFRMADNIVTSLKEYKVSLILNLKGQEISPSDIEKVKGVYDSLILKLPELFPAMLVLGVFIYAYLGYEITRIILAKMGCQLAKFLPISVWQVPDLFVWGFILAWMAVLIGGYLGVRDLYIVGLNVRYIFEAIYTVIGIGLVSFFLGKYNLPPVAKVLAYIIILFGLQIVMFAGVFDTWFDFRRLKSAKKGVVN